MTELIWIIGGLIIFAIEVIILGFRGEGDFELFGIAACLAICWPLIVPVAILVFPFIGLYLLAKYIGKHIR